MRPAQDLSEDVIEAVKGSLHVAIQAAPGWAKAWHSWALFNVHAMEHYGRSSVAVAQRHVAPAVTAFFKSVALGQASGSAFPSPARAPRGFWTLSCHTSILKVQQLRHKSFLQALDFYKEGI